MNRGELVRKVARSASVPSAVAGRIVQAIFDQILLAFIRGEKLPGDVAKLFAQFVPSEKLLGIPHIKKLAKSAGRFEFSIFSHPLPAGAMQEVLRITRTPGALRRTGEAAEGSALRLEGPRQKGKTSGTSSAKRTTGNGARSSAPSKGAKAPSKGGRGPVSSRTRPLARPNVIEPAATETRASTEEDVLAVSHEMPAILGEPAVIDPPRESFALVRCDDKVIAQREFLLEVGLSMDPVAGVSGPPINRPDSSVGPFWLEVQVVAESFMLAAGQTWRRRIRVTAAKPYPSEQFLLASVEVEEDIARRTIRVSFAIDGQTVAIASREVVVVRTEALLASSPSPEEPAATVVAPPVGVPAPDLTLEIQSSETGAPGRLLMTIRSPHDVSLPDAPLICNIGDHPDAFAKALVNRVNAASGIGLVFELKGQAQTIADKLPGEFWDVLRAVAAKASPRTPTILILSEEPYVPWELSWMDPPLVTGAPAFLSAQAIVGRWLFRQKSKPLLPPPAQHEVAEIAVVWGVYDKPGWQRLLEAEREAAQLQADYHADSVNATETEVLLCLGRGTPPADLVHFAVHGSYDPTGTQDGLVLTDGHTLDAEKVRAADIGRPRFVFLNACQVGSGNQVLGDYLGLSAAFLRGGACALIAPLWSVRDTDARRFATDFYASAFADQPPAEVLQKARRRYDEDPDNPASTYMAYVFFGHPSFRLSRL